MSSTVPNVSIKNRNKELLIVSARDKDNFIIEFLSATHGGELIMSNNYFDNQQDFTIERIVSAFYEGTIKNVIRLKSLTPAEPDDIKRYKLRDYPLFISGLTTGILTLILIFDFWSNGIFFVSFIILSMGFSALVTLQYILTDWGKEVSFGQDGVLEIKNKTNEIKIKKSDIDQVVIVGNDNHRTLRHYKYARIKTKDGNTFIVTSFIIEPIDLVNKLRVNHKSESVFLPTINLDILTEKQKEKIKREKEKKKIKFLETFKNYEDSKLRQIIKDKRSYADYAIEAATEILEKRKKL